MLVGCQNAIQVGVVNMCARTVEAQEDQAGWARVSAGKREHLVSVSEGTTQLNVQVRSDENQPAIRFAVSLASLSKPPRGVDEDVEVVLEGERCPPA
jgi:hypothetical protein